MEQSIGTADVSGGSGMSRRWLNLVTAAEAHVLWKTRLGHHVAGNMREPLESAPLAQDEFCRLGSWIEGSVFAPFCEPELLRQLSAAHQQFHRLSMHIVELLEAGDRSGAEAVYSDEYSRSLRDIIAALAIIDRRQIFPGGN